jgi:hypothetical protein
MKKFALLLFGLSLLLFVSQAGAQSGWIYGTVASAPVQVTYGFVMYTFNFQVSASSESLVNSSLTCVWVDEPVQGQTYNFSGGLVADNSSGVPLGVFLVSSVNTNATASSNETALVQVWSDMAQLGGLIVNAVAKFIVSSTGYSLSPMIAGVAVLGFMGLVFSFLGSHLRWYVDLVGLFIALSILAYIAPLVIGLVPS